MSDPDYETIHCATQYHQHRVGSCPHCEIDALRSQLAEAQARVADYEDSYRVTIEDCGAPDEKHCSCVPSLRQRIAELTEREASRFKLACEWRHTAEQLRKERDQWEARAEAAERDAERYRWLRDRINWRDRWAGEKASPSTRWREWVHDDYRQSPPQSEHIDDYLDAAIDAARAAP